MRCLFFITFLLCSCSVGKIFKPNPTPAPAVSSEFDNLDKNNDSMISISEYQGLSPEPYDYEGPVMWFSVILFFVFLFSSVLAYIINRK
tara:strand:- start:1924 stop:2190 length:267 start_codon:yes stop_codon:yes gene_type:complete